MRLFGSLLFVAALAVALTGCNGASGGNSTTGASAGGPKKLEIAVIPKGSTHEYWKSIHAGADDAAKELGNVDIIWQGPLKEDDRDEQIKVVDDMVSKGVQGIVLAPLDDQALRQPVVDAQNANIPVVIIDSDLKDLKTTSFIATDNYKGGQFAGDYMVKLLNGKGKIVMLRYEEGSASTEKREQGFLDAVKKAPGIQVLSENQHAGATVETAMKASENLLQRFRNPDGSLGLDGIYTPNESSTTGMLRTLTGENWAGKVKFVGFDSSKDLDDALASGQINGLVLQNPRKMGYLGVKAVVDKINGKVVQDKVDTGATLVTTETMKQPDMQKLLNPLAQPPQ